MIVAWMFLICFGFPIGLILVGVCWLWVVKLVLAHLFHGSQ